MTGFLEEAIIECEAIVATPPMDRQVTVDRDYLRVVMLAAKTASNLGPFEIVQGDASRKLQPHANQMVNSMSTWVVGTTARSKHLLEKTVDKFNEILAMEGTDKS